MIRVDYEVRRPVPAPVEAALCQVIAQQLRRTDIVLISDYDKGVCTPGVMASLVAAARQWGLRVVADPVRGEDYRKYHGCSAITPNRLEASLATGCSIQSVADALNAGDRLRELLDLEAAVITLDKDGMAMSHRDGRRQHFPTRPRQVYDITGAGDMVMATMAMTLAAGADYDAAIPLANIAGGLEVEKVGVVPVSRDEILRDLFVTGHVSEVGQGAGIEKLFGRQTLVQEIDCRRRLGHRIAFTNGCFDVLHAGHVQYLREARAQADLLVVGLNSDASVRSLKGLDRPVNDAASRAAVLNALAAVDYVTVFDELTPLELIRAVRPDVLVKGADYQRDEVVGGDFVMSHGGRVHLATLREGCSTTRILRLLGAA
jgi:D-beta-D-heptose 7-phosphate kinase/D-beta-D-heptose 1-phosphate adenosyltransferase